MTIYNKYGIIKGLFESIIFMLSRKSIIIQNRNITYYHSTHIEKNNIVFFLHGWGSQALHFQKTLKKCKNFIAVDLPGFGDSESPTSPWSLDDYVDFIKEFLKKINIQNPIIAGHSFGGSIGIKYCAQGNAAQKLILIGSSGIRPKTAKKHGLYIITKICKIPFSLPGIRTFKDAVRNWFYKKIDSEDYIHAGTLTETYKKIIDEDLTAELQKIYSPTILIWGENDIDTPLENGKRIKKLIKNSQLFIIPNAGHYVFLDEQMKFEEIFLSHIQ